jgi:hypothetical protein
MMVVTWFILFTAIGVIIPAIGKLIFKREFTLQEWLTVSVVNMIICGFVVFAGSYSSMSDTEIHNGHVTHKHSEKVSCEHSYPCNCRQVSCGKNCTTTQCDTCYQHSYDIDWVVNTTIGKILVPRINPQGTKEPPRYSIVEISEPVSKEFSFTNYIKASPESLFHLAKTEHNYIIPDYPTVYDLYRINRVISTHNLYSGKLNELLNAELKTLSSKKQVNVVVVLTEYDYNFVDALKSSWVGAKQNDVVVVIGLKDNQIEYSSSFGFSQDSMVYTTIDGDVKKLKEYNDKSVSDIILSNVDNYFVRKSMEEYAYLKDLIEPPVWVIVLGLLLSIIGTTVATIMLSKNDCKER